MKRQSEQGGQPQQPGAEERKRHRRHGAWWRWGAGIGIAVGFHLGLLGFARVAIQPQRRADRIDPRVTWVGDAAVLEEDTVRGQLLRSLDDTPLFMITDLNFASRRVESVATQRPGEIFSSYDPILKVPVDRGPPGLVTAPIDRLDPTSALQAFSWRYLSYFGRTDPAARKFEARRAHIEVRSLATGTVVAEESLATASDHETPEVWPDWRWFEMYLSISETGRMSEPTLVGGGSGSDRVDQFMRDHVGRRMRLDLRLGPGNYRVIVGP